MSTPDDIFRIADEAAFEAAALEVFRRQAAECAPYREYLSLIGVQPGEVRTADAIPYLPIGLFKTHEVYCGGPEPEAVFTSSSTTGMTPSRHPMRSLSLYEQAFRASFRTFYGEPARWSLYALLPNYLRRKGSSLVYMADRLLSDCGSGGFYLDDHEALLEAMRRDPKPKILLGVSYALWDLAERYAPKLDDTIVMETGGMKGYREEIPKAEFHKILCDAFGVDRIHSEYGMAELTSQAYSQGGNIFRCPAWMRVAARDVNDPFDRLPAGSRGGLDIADLASWWSCAFIQTQDVGRVAADGAFEVEGRVGPSDIGGCSLLVLEFAGKAPGHSPRAGVLRGTPAAATDKRGGGIDTDRQKREIAMKTVAFVPLRLNSQRVAGKNLRLLGGEPLMCHILRTLAGIGEIDEVYAYCSDERICEYLPRSVRFLRRSPGLDRDTTLGREIYDSFTADVEADLYVLAHATSPFIRAETVADALRHVRSGEYDSAFSAEKIQTFAWFEGRPLNYALDDIPRTQTIEPVYIETSAFFIFPRTLWCGRGRRIGEKPYMAVVDRIEGLDIDNPEDFTMAEIIAASRRLG